MFFLNLITSVLEKFLKKVYVDFCDQVLWINFKFSYFFSAKFDTVTSYSFLKYQMFTYFFYHVLLFFLFSWPLFIESHCLFMFVFLAILCGNFHSLLTQFLTQVILFIFMASFHISHFCSDESLNFIFCVNFSFVI